MKISILAVLAALMISFSARAQEEKVTIRSTETSLSSLISEIEGQTGFLFGVDEGIDLSRRVSIAAENESVRSALDKALAGTGLKYEIRDRHIFLGRADVAAREMQEILPYSDRIEASEITDSLKWAGKFYHENPFTAFTRQIGHDFSKEGRKDWKMEVMTSLYSNLGHDGYNLAVGLRLDDARTWGIGVAKDSFLTGRSTGRPIWHKTVPVFLWSKHYYPIGRRFYITNEAMLGAQFKTDSGSWDGRTVTVPDVQLYLCFRPALDFRIAWNVHAFLGLFFSTFGGAGFMIGLTL